MQYNAEMNLDLGGVVSHTSACKAPISLSIPTQNHISVVILNYTKNNVNTHVHVHTHTHVYIYTWSLCMKFFVMLRRILIGNSWYSKYLVFNR